jgi:rod shape determining protein RodA
MARRYKLWSNIDWLTVTIYFLLVILGWFNIYSAVYDNSHQSIFDLSQRYGKQIIWILCAFGIGFIILLVEVNFYTFFAYGLYGVSILGLILVLVFGAIVHGSKSWFHIGDLGFQPSEFAKFATGLALAKFLSTVNFRYQRTSHILIATSIILLPVIIILFQNDTGSALVFLSFILVMYREGMSGVVLFFAALISLLFFLSLSLGNQYLLIILFAAVMITLLFFNLRLRDFLKVFLISAIVVFVIFLTNYLTNLDAKTEYLLFAASLIISFIFLYFTFQPKWKKFLVILLVYFGSVFFTFSVDFIFKNALEPYHQRRINELLGINPDPLGAGYNVNQSKIAIGSGGFWGKGFLNGTQTKFNFVPEQSTDFIFCTVGEEWGFVGSLIVIGLFVILLIRLTKIAERQRSAFSRIYGYAVVSVLLFHVAVNIGMTVGIMPVIGIPLPFFSYGGSSLWAFTILLFVFIRLDASRLDKLI